MSARRTNRCELAGGATSRCRQCCHNCKVDEIVLPPPRAIISYAFRLTINTAHGLLAFGVLLGRCLDIGVQRAAREYRGSRECGRRWLTRGPRRVEEIAIRCTAWWPPAEPTRMEVWSMIPALRAAASLLPSLAATAAGAATTSAKLLKLCCC
jgi:hypothetical protein